VAHVHPSNRLLPHFQSPTRCGKFPNFKDEFSDRKVTLIQAWTLPRWLKGIPAADVSEINDENKGSRVR